MVEPILAVHNLAKRFGGLQAIDNLSFEVAAATVHAIIGPNGAGKTTLLNLLTGIYRPDEGRIRLAGQDVTGQPTHRWAAAGLGRTFQNLQIFFNMSALENVMAGRHLRQRCEMLPSLLRTPSLTHGEAACREHARELMHTVGLDAYLDARADSMPYGALKRLEIARALALEPKVLLLDEPAAGLNHSEAREIDALIRELAGAGMTVVLVEHNMRLVMDVSDRVLVLERGARLAEGTPEDVARDERVIEAYLGASDPLSDGEGGDA